MWRAARVSKRCPDRSENRGALLTLGATGTLASRARKQAVTNHDAVALPHGLGALLTLGAMGALASRARKQAMSRPLRKNHSLTVVARCEPPSSPFRSLFV